MPLCPLDPRLSISKNRRAAETAELNPSSTCIFAHRAASSSEGNCVSRGVFSTKPLSINVSVFHYVPIPSPLCSGPYSNSQDLRVILSSSLPSQVRDASFALCCTVPHCSIKCCIYLSESMWRILNALMCTQRMFARVLNLHKLRILQIEERVPHTHNRYFATVGNGMGYITKFRTNRNRVAVFLESNWRF